MTIQIVDLTELVSIAADDYVPVRDTSAGIDKRITPANLIAGVYTAADVLTKLLTVDVDNSGLNATTLQGNGPGAFATAGHTHTIAHSSTTGLDNDDHTQYLLADGSRNGAATIVASSASATPLTLKMASGQTAAGLRVIDSGNNDLVRVDANGSGWHTKPIIVGNNVANSVWNYNSDGYIDYGSGYGEVDFVAVNHTVADIYSPFSSSTSFAGANILVLLDDQGSPSGKDDGIFAYGVYGQVATTPASTRVPGYIYGLNFAAYNRSNQSVSTISAMEIYADSTGGGNAIGMHGLRAGVYIEGTGIVQSVTGQELYVYGYTSSVHTYGALLYGYAPTGSFATFCGVDIENVAGITATTAYAIRTQGGQTLHQTGAAATVGLVVQGAASQAADQIQSKNSAGTVEFAVGAGGKLKTNQAAANTHTPSGATAKQLPIYDQAGTLLGYIPIYGSAW